MTIPDDFPINTEVVAHGQCHDIPWVAARSPFYGAVNGYCRLPDAHPWLDPDIEDYEIKNSVPWGEITFRRGNWVGFDTTHAGQRWEGEPHPFSGDTLITEEMAIGWAELLAHDATDVVFGGNYCI